MTEVILSKDEVSTSKDNRLTRRIDTFSHIMWALGLILNFGLVLFKLVLPGRLQETRFDYLIITLLVFLLFPTLRKFKAFGLEFEAERIENVELKVKAIDSRLKALPDYILGTEYYEEKDYQLARRSLEKSLEEDGTFWPSKYLLGTIASEQGKYDDARLAFEGVLAIDPCNIYALNNLADVYSEAPFPIYNPELALSYASEVLKLEPTFGSALLYKCEALNRLGRYSEAAEILRQLDKDESILPTQRHWVMYGLALAYSNLGNKMNADSLQEMYELALNHEEGEKFLKDIENEVELFGEEARKAIHAFIDEHKKRKNIVSAEE